MIRVGQKADQWRDGPLRHPSWSVSSEISQNGLYRSRFCRRFEVGVVFIDSSDVVDKIKDTSTSRQAFHHAFPLDSGDSSS